MSKRCDICGREPRKSFTRSHSNIATSRRQFVNLQSRKVEGKQVKICTRCLRTAKKNKK